MGQVLVGTDGRRLVLTPRSGSHSLAAAWLQQEEPGNYAAWQAEPLLHPARFLAVQESPGQSPSGAELAVVVRNPVERFRSMIAHRQLNIDEQLASPMYPPISSLPYTRLFRFEDQLQEAATWIGIAEPLPVVDPSEPQNKPTLTPAQEAQVRAIYASDVAMWESL